MNHQQHMIKDALEFAVLKTSLWPDIQEDYELALELYNKEMEPSLMTNDELKELIHTTRNQCQALELELALRSKKL